MASDKTLKAVKESVGKIILILANAVYMLEKDIVPSWDKERAWVIENLKEAIDKLKEVI